MSFNFHGKSAIVNEGQTLDYMRQLYEGISLLGRPFLDIYETALDATQAGINPVYALNKVRRSWILSKLFLQSRDVAGDIAECGVFRGTTSRLLVELLQMIPHRKLDGQLLLFDSYEGLSPAVVQDSLDYDCCNPNDAHVRFGFDAKRFTETSAERVASLFAQWPWVSVEAGWIPAVFAGHQRRRFSFVHLDVDLYQPTRDSLSFFVPRMNPGGLILCDDYLSPEFPGVRRAWDEYCHEHDIQFVALDSNQAVMMPRELAIDTTIEHFMQVKQPAWSLARSA